MTDVVLLVARLLLGVPFIVWGVMKLRGGDASLVPVLAKMGMPDAKFLAFMVGLCEFVGGVGVVLGKASNNDRDVTWITVSGGGSVGTVDGGVWAATYDTTIDGGAWAATYS